MAILKPFSIMSHLIIYLLLISTCYASSINHQQDDGNEYPNNDDNQCSDSDKDKFLSPSNIGPSRHHSDNDIHRHVKSDKFHRCYSDSRIDEGIKRIFQPYLNREGGTINEGPETDPIDGKVDL